MQVIGIDLAAQPKSTGAVLLTTADGVRWKANELDELATDDLLVATAQLVDVVGVDAPLGWPTDFVAAVTAHVGGAPWPGGANRVTLTHRETDRAVQQAIGRKPLSVSAGKLGAIAMRCALLQHRWATEIWGQVAPRDGTGSLVETYPMAALRAWDIDPTGYKGIGGPKAETRRAARELIVDRVSTACGSWLDITPTTLRCVESDHVLDGLVSALVAIAAKCDATVPVSDPKAAQVEGRIHLPNRGLADPRRLAFGTTDRATSTT
jgi:hypothetical protein